MSLNSHIEWTDATWNPVRGLIAVLLGLVVCFPWSDARASSETSTKARTQHPDKVLYDRGVSAVEQQRFTIANLTLQTLVNTFLVPSMPAGPDACCRTRELRRVRQPLASPRVSATGEQRVRLP